MNYLNQENFLIMKINELRIGNHVFFDKEKVLQMKVSYFNSFYFNRLEGVPIDEEFLKENLIYFEFGDDFLINEWEGMITLEYQFAEIYTNLNHIEFVHQLENLIYDLTNKTPAFTFKYLENE